MKQIFHPGYKPPGYKYIYFYYYFFHSFHYEVGFFKFRQKQEKVKKTKVCNIFTFFFIEEYLSLSGFAKHGQKLVRIVIWLYVASKNVAFLYLWTVPKMDRLTLKASRNTNCQQLNLNLIAKVKLKMMKIILK